MLRQGGGLYHHLTRALKKMHLYQNRNMEFNTLILNDSQAVHVQRGKTVFRNSNDRPTLVILMTL